MILKIDLLNEIVDPMIITSWRQKEKRSSGQEEGCKGWRRRGEEGMLFLLFLGVIVRIIIIYYITIANRLYYFKSYNTLVLLVNNTKYILFCIHIIIFLWVYNYY